MRIGGGDKDAILKQVKTKNYQLACQRHFEATHKGHEAAGISTDGVGNHPNAWMHASMAFHKAKVEYLLTLPTHDHVNFTAQETKPLTYKNSSLPLFVFILIFSKASAGR